MKKLLLMLPLSCFQPPPADCVSTRGLKIANPLFSCEEYQRAEDLAMQAFLSSPDTRLHSPNRLMGVTVEVIDAPAFTDLGVRVSGRTYCDLHYVKINNLEPNHSTLTHELAHVLQDCYPLQPENPKNVDHSNWDRDGIYAAIWEVFTHD